MAKEALSGWFDSLRSLRKLRSFGFAHQDRGKSSFQSRHNQPQGSNSASQSSSPTSQNSFLDSSFLFRCIARQNQLHQKRRDAPVFAHGRSLTTNHLLT